MEYNKEFKRISGDSVLVDTAAPRLPIICKTVGGTMFIVRMHYNERSKINIDDKLLSLMGEEMKQDIS